MHGVVEGKAIALRLAPTSGVSLQAFADDLLARAAIEGEQLVVEVVQLSIWPWLSRGELVHFIIYRT